MTGSISDSESARVRALASYDIMDTPPDEVFDRLTRLARRLFDVPIALISFIDDERQWFKSRLGFADEQLPRDTAFCTYTLLGEDVFEVADASTHPLFAANPLVTGEPGVRFYAGAPLVTEDGFCIGTLCVFDTSPRRLDPDQVSVLKDLAAMAVNELDLRRRAAFDSLTGLFTQRHLVELGERELRAANRYDYTLSVLALRIDGLASIKRTYGEKKHNSVLAAVAHRCKPILREQDIFGCYRDNIFVIAASHTDKRGALLLSEKLQEAVRAIALDGGPGIIRATISIGATMLDGVDDTFAIVLDRALAALDDAGNAGQGQVVINAAA